MLANVAGPHWCSNAALLDLTTLILTLFPIIFKVCSLSLCACVRTAVRARACLCVERTVLS